MTFLERYTKEETWWGKVLIMEIFHLTMSQKDNTWTVGKTAEQFQCSIGLVSENLRLAHASHNSLPIIINCDTREQALKMLVKEVRSAKITDFSGPPKRQM